MDLISHQASSETPDQFARSFLAFMRSTPMALYDVKACWLTDDAESIGHEILKRLALSGPSGLQHVVLTARDGLRLADDVVREIIRERQIMGHSMPPYLQAYAADLISGWAPPRKPGQRREKRIFRDIAIVVVIAEVVHRFKIHPTRGKWSATESACSIVHRAWQAEKMKPGLAEASICEAWRKFGNAALSDSAMDFLNKSEH